VDAAYFGAQKALQPYQGINNLWLAGIYMHDIDCHESAVVSGIKVAQALAPNSPRLRQLTSTA
jgi:predicted NAD/FAD-binding protein